MINFDVIRSMFACSLFFTKTYERILSWRENSCWDEIVISTVLFKNLFLRQLILLSQEHSMC